jgi:prepilin peptidase CpaA
MLVQTILNFAPLGVLLVWAAATDVRTRRIPNWLTLGLIFAGVARGIVFGSDGAGPALLGTLAGAALPLLLFILHALGGGDVKLFAAVGSWIGPRPAVAVFVVAAIVALLIVLVQCAATGKLKTLLSNSAAVVASLFRLRRDGVELSTGTARSFRTIDRPLPYAVPILTATVAVVAAGIFRS